MWLALAFCVFLLFCNDFGSDEVAVHVFAWRRRASLLNLFAGLSAGLELYSQLVSLPLYIHLDKNYSAQVAIACEEYRWDFGLKTVAYTTFTTPSDDDPLKVGSRLEFLLTPIDVSSAEFHLLLEDDVVLSPAYWIYVRWCTRFLKERELGSVVGCSLSTPKFNEMESAIPTELNLDQQYNSTILQIQVPSSWGAVYRGSFIAELQEELDLARNAKVEANLSWIHVPHYLKWQYSWKKHATKLLAQKSYALLYPNFFNGTSFAAHLNLLGVHSAHPKDSEYMQKILCPTLQLDLQPPIIEAREWPLFSYSNVNYIEQELAKITLPFPLLTAFYKAKENSAVERTSEMIREKRCGNAQ